MSRKGVVKASVERNFGKIMDLNKKGIVYNVWIDSSRKIKVITDAENDEISNKFKNKTESNLFYRQYIVLGSSDFDRELREVTNLEDLIILLNRLYIRNDNDISRTMSKKDNVERILRELKTFEKKVYDLAKKYKLTKEEINWIGKPVTEFDNYGIKISAGTLSTNLHTETRLVSGGRFQDTGDDYNFFKNKWLEKADIRYGSTGHEVPEKDYSFRYINFIQETNELTLKTYTKIAKMLLSEIKK